MIFVHPQSQFCLDLQDNSRSLSLPFFPDNIRFPTRTACLDSMIATILDPPSGRVSGKRGTMLRYWISYLFTYNLRNYSQLAISNQNMPRCCCQASDQKISPTLTISYEVHLSPGRIMYCVVRRCSKKLIASNSPFLSKNQIVL